MNYKIDKFNYQNQPIYKKNMYYVHPKDLVERQHFPAPNYVQNNATNLIQYYISKQNTKSLKNKEAISSYQDINNKNYSNEKYKGLSLDLYI